MASSAAPTLSAKGYITAVPEKTDQLIAWFFASDVNQSLLFDGQISNIQNLFQTYMHDIPGLKNGLRSALENYLSRYYDMALVTVEDDGDTNLSNRLNLYLVIEVTQDGKQYSAANLLSTVDGKFEKIQKINNTGG